MATPPNGISPIHVMQAELAQMRSAGRNLSQEVLRLQRVEIHLAAVVKALVGGPGCEKAIPVDVVNATIPASLHLNVTDGLVMIKCTAPPAPAAAETPESTPEAPQPPRILEP